MIQSAHDLASKSISLFGSIHWQSRHQQNSRGEAVIEGLGLVSLFLSKVKSLITSVYGPPATRSISSQQSAALHWAHISMCHELPPPITSIAPVSSIFKGLIAVFTNASCRSSGLSQLASPGLLGSRATTMKYQYYRGGGARLPVRASSLAVVMLVMVVMLGGPAAPVEAAIDNVAFQWTNLLNVLWCPNGAVFTSSIQPQLHLAQWHALLALRATGDCTTEEAVVAYASHKILSHYFSWGQDNPIGALLHRQLQSWALTPRQKRLAKRLGEAVAVSLIAQRSPANEFVLGPLVEALDANPRPAVGVFRYFTDSPPPNATFAFDTIPLERPFVIPHPIQFVKDYLPDLKPMQIPSAEWDENWKALKDIGRADWSGRTPEMNLLANLIACGRVNNTLCSREQIATASAQAALPATTSLYDSVVLLAKISVSIYDAVIAHTLIKFGYWFWRPVHAYPAGDPQHGPIPSWKPYRRTPAEPEYPSGTVTAVSAGARPLRNFLGKDVPFTIKGGGVFNCPDYVGVPIPDRNYNSVGDLVDEAKLARMYAGAHWKKSVDDGVKVGFRVADYIEKHWTDTMPSGVLPHPTHLDVLVKLPKKSGEYSPLKFDI